MHSVSLELFRTLALHLHRNERLDSETSKMFILFLKKTGETDRVNFRSVCMEDIAIVEDIAQADIFLYDIDIVDGSTIVQLARRSVGKHSNTKRLLRYNSHISHVYIFNSLNAYLCPSRHQVIKTVQQLERHLTTCKERVKHVFPKNVHQLGETRFGNLKPLNIPYAFNDQKLFKNMAFFDLESICVQERKFYRTDATT